MISSSDILFLRPYRIDDTSLTGGISTNIEITNDELSNLFRDVSAEYIFWGGERFRKLFIKNNNPSGTFYSVGVYIDINSQSDDYFSVVSGTATDYGKDADDYSGWYSSGTLNSSIVGRSEKPEGPVTDYFYIVPVASGSGFYSNSRVVINQSKRYEIVRIGEVSWISPNLARLTMVNESVDSFSSGAIVSSIYELGDMVPEGSVSVWLKQTIPVDTAYKRLCKLRIGIIGA